MNAFELRGKGAERLLPWDTSTPRTLYFIQISMMKNLTHIWIKMAWHYLSLWFLHHLHYVAKTRKPNVSRNKPEFNKMILVSTSNFISQKKPVSAAACICFYIFVGTDTHQSSLFSWQLSTTNLQQEEEKPQASRALPATVSPDCFSFLLIPIPKHGRADLAPVPKIIHQASPSLVPGV